MVTQSIKANQYEYCSRYCSSLFPNYKYRFGFEGKYANVKLFRTFKAPYPETAWYESVEDFRTRHFRNHEPHMSFPFVLKGDRGGGGWAVFLVSNPAELSKWLNVLDDASLHPTRRFIAQAFVAHGGRDLRVVVIGRTTKAYWRCQTKEGEFRNNVGRGALINYDLDPDLMEKGINCVRDFCRQTGINLAAFDVLFDRGQATPQPLLSEINFLFGRRGLGGSPRFYELLNESVKEWIGNIA